MYQLIIYPKFMKFLPVFFFEQNFFQLLTERKTKIYIYTYFLLVTLI